MYTNVYGLYPMHVFIAYSCILYEISVPIRLLAIHIFYTYLRYSVSVYQCIQAVYQSVFNFQKLKPPFKQCIWIAINPDFDFCFLYAFQPVYQGITCVYRWHTTFFNTCKL